MNIMNYLIFGILFLNKGSLLYLFIIAKLTLKRLKSKMSLIKVKPKKEKWKIQKEVYKKTFL